MKKIKVGVIGAAGYTGGELTRLLLNHPFAEVQYVISKSQAGKPVSLVHTDLYGDTDMYFTEEPQEGSDVVFLCMSHGEAKKYLTAHKFLYKKKIIDLSRDFRGSESFTYGLPELNREAIKKVDYIANPGCFATAIQLGLLPLAENGLIQGDIQVNATTGSTGAGQNLSFTSHFSWRNNNLSVYKAFEHEHLSEIKKSLAQLQSGFSQELHFIPQRGAFSRGILATLNLHCERSLGSLTEMYKQYYAVHPFVHLVENADVKQVANTNKCFIQLIKYKDQLAIISVIDNLLKGASGQAVQNMNLMFGLEETAGLKLKANVY